jgi:hypothetical protein
LVCLLDADGVEVARRPWQIASMAPGTVTLGLPLSAVAPGPYRLLVSASASGDAAAAGERVEASQEVRIRVREAR